MLYVIIVILLHCIGHIITCVIMVILLYYYIAIIDLCSAQVKDAVKSVLRIGSAHKKGDPQI